MRIIAKIRVFFKDFCREHPNIGGLFDFTKELLLSLSVNLLMFTTASFWYCYHDSWASLGISENFYLTIFKPLWSFFLPPTFLDKSLLWWVEHHL